MSASLNISTVAYSAIPGLVFVRVPNERGRWMLTDRCVVERDCPLCKAITGEPCRSRYQRWDLTANAPFRKEAIPASEIRYTTGTHAARRRPCNRGARPKLQLSLPDIEAAREVLHD